MSNADLLFCDGLKNLNDTTGLNFFGAKLTSEICRKFGIEYVKYEVNAELIQSFDSVKRDEKETAIVLRNDREVSLPLEEYFTNQKVDYISDLHLVHRIFNAKCKSVNDIIYLLTKVVRIITSEMSSDILLIGGDTSSDFFVFKLFVRLLRKVLEEKRKNTKVIFILGNHDLWSFQGRALSDIFNKYNVLLKNYGMYLLDNDIIYKDNDNRLKKITKEEILSYDKVLIRKRLCTSRLIIFGGVAFSGYNEDFNADNGIYRSVIDRKTEIEETKKFENLYEKVCDVLSDKNLIVFTHTPLKDWNRDQVLHKNFVYVNGHTHRNIFYDDGEYRIYADNQIGYRNKNPHLKYFYVETDYDFFSDYKDGIYEITKDQYMDFYRGKNIQMDIGRKVNILYMLKKNGYYCFIHKSKNGSLAILNGGALRKLDQKECQYYYDNMEKVIAYIKRPLDIYTKFQKQISDEIKKIGGSGNIHGCIVDIDFYSHIYVNPIDMMTTGYWAHDIINKQVYTSIPSLLKEHCSELYERYLKLDKSDEKNKMICRNVEVAKTIPLSQAYIDTDIYNASRELKKMQKLGNNILCCWYETDNDELVIEKKSY